MTIKLINETCYSTEDLELLAEKCEESMAACDEQMMEGSGHSGMGTNNAPESIRVGYYQPAPTSYRYQGAYKFINSTGYGPDMRLGIVKRSGLGIIPLVALAQAADGADMKMPQEAVDEFVKFFAGLHGYSYHVLPSRMRGDSFYGGTDENYDAHWEWTKGFEIHYRMRAKRGSKAKVKTARELAKLNKLKDSLSNKESDVTCAEWRLKAAKKAVVDSKRDIATLSKKLGV